MKRRRKRTKRIRKKWSGAGDDPSLRIDYTRRLRRFKIAGSFVGSPDLTARHWKIFCRRLTRESCCASYGTGATVNATIGQKAFCEPRQVCERNFVFLCLTGVLILSNQHADFLRRPIPFEGLLPWLRLWLDREASVGRGGRVMYSREGRSKQNVLGPIDVKE
jgi:hypothetical protein